MSSKKSACFDVIGTCFSFERTIGIIRQRLGSRLEPHNIDPKTLFFSWFYAAQRDFTYLTVIGEYTTIAAVLKATFKRACLIVDLPAEDTPSDDDVAAVMKAFTQSEAREGLKGCFDGLRDAGWDVYGVTNGGLETSLNYYKQADIALDSEHLLSCDDLKAAKPDLRVYLNATEKLDAKGLGSGEGDRWFVAAHSWDLIAARKVGFKTAYLSFEEHDAVEEIFGKFDLYADSMGELLEKMKKL